MLKKTAALVLALAYPLGTWAAATPAEPGSPAATVESLQAALIANMKSKDDCKVRLKTLEPKVAASFDFDLIAQKLVRKHWKELDDAQRARLTTAVAHSAAVTYTTQFSEYGGERFELGATAAGGGGQRVSAQLIIPDGPPVAFEYALRQTDTGWKIINVVAQGVSDLAIRSAQYDSQFTREGFDGLLKNLEIKDQEALSTCGPAIR